MSRRGMPNGMRAHSLGNQRRYVSPCLSDMTLHKRVDPESCGGLAAAIEKDAFGLRPSGHQRRQCGGCLRPERTVTHFVALPSKLHRGIAATGHVAQLEIGDRGLRGFVGASARVIETPKERV